MDKSHKDIIIIGGGAAGLMAAIGAAKMGARPTILEKMPRPARKIMITGKGRCNFTNVKDWNDFAPNIRSKASFIKKAFRDFKPEDVLSFFEENGLPYVVERGGRAFPASYKASDVVDTLVRCAKEGGAEILSGKEVSGIEKENDIFIASCLDGSTYSCRSLIIATGGLSYPSTGSSGDGYRFAEGFGHHVTPCFPSLTALVPTGYKQSGAKGHIPRETPLSATGGRLCGVSLKNCGISLYAGNDLVQQEFGDIDFTDGGIEGPVGFAISRSAVKGMINGGKMKIVIDLKSAIEPDELESRIARLWKEFHNQNEVLSKLLPRSIMGAFLHTSSPLPKEPVKFIKALGTALKNWSFPLQGYVGYERCVVTAGGISTDEVSAHTMESSLCRNLYFCGEVLDIDANTGGYNLQCAFSTGLLAGMSAAARN